MAAESQDIPEATAGDVTNDVDVLVVGGGTAGTIAAIQAGRAGARTMLVERNSQLGGTTTTGGVAFPGLFDAWGKQIIAGIGWEMVRDSVELDGGTFPDFSKIPQHHWQNQVSVNPFLYAILAEESAPRQASGSRTTNSPRQSPGPPRAGRSTVRALAPGAGSCANRSSIAPAARWWSGC